MTTSDIFLCLPVFCTSKQWNDFQTETPGILDIPYTTEQLGNNGVLAPLS